MNLKNFVIRTREKKREKEKTFEAMDNRAAELKKNKHGLQYWRRKWKKKKNKREM